MRPVRRRYRDGRKALKLARLLAQLDATAAATRPVPAGRRRATDAGRVPAAVASSCASSRASFSAFLASRYRLRIGRIPSSPHRPLLPPN